MTTRLFIAAAILLGIAGGVSWVRGRGMPTQPTPLEMKAEDLPPTFGDWKGEAVALDPEMFAHIGAQMAIDRMYHDRRGNAISLHMAVFDKSDGFQGLPHQPEVCYTSGGWHMGDARPVSLDRTNDNLAKLCPVERRGDNCFVLYWYQIDGRSYFTGDRQRQIMLGLRGRATRPPVVKVMLHVNAANPVEAEKLVTSVASQVFAWTKDFH